MATRIRGPRGNTYGKKNALDGPRDHWWHESHDSSYDFEYVCVSLVWPDRFFPFFFVVAKKNGKKRSGHARLRMCAVFTAHQVRKLVHLHLIATLLAVMLLYILPIIFPH